ncbi:curli polymerization inhibitor CsgI-related protein [Conservatibacter flavescens]|uniref:UPF0319 protein CVP05_00230 n=1 Tax=Conservatibacter flavescens TaxID=28161 RepID=A0A2M8S573_9PAST|nr:DUF2057 domain-containing protein [Conservatibacter flavescens]PJG86281.1 hypothetical protein CVP05_00230 [Conservatibacter flavescens]
MKLRHVALTVATLLASSTAFAGVVTSSSNIDFLAIDGQKTSKSLLKDTNSFNATAGQKHQVVVRVSEIVRLGSDRSLFESDPIIVTFQGTQEDLVISAPRLDNERDVETFKKDPQITLKTTSGKTISSQQDRLKQEGFLPNANLEENLAQYNASGAVAAIPALVSTAMPAAVPGFAKAQKGKIIVQGENVAEQQLQYWFQQADKETQTRFLNWAKKQ